MAESRLRMVARIHDEFNDTLEVPRWALRDDVEWQPPSDEPDNASRFGANAATAYVREWAGTFDDYRCEVEELIERGACVIAVIHLRGRIGEQGQELSIPLTQVWTIDDDLVVQVREYRTKQEALEAT